MDIIDFSQYKIYKKQDEESYEKRIQKVTDSLKRINKLMKELKQLSEGN